MSRGSTTWTLDTEGRVQSSRTRRRRGILAALTSILVAAIHACVGSPSPPTPTPVTVADLDGAWTGVIEVEAQRIPGTLLLRQSGERLEATLSAAELGGESTGTGEVDSDGEVRIALRYRTQCAGSLALTGAVLDGGTRLAGSLTATDCTGRAAGAFSFGRR